MKRFLSEAWPALLLMITFVVFLMIRQLTREKYGAAISADEACARPRMVQPSRRSIVHVKDMKVGDTGWVWALEKIDGKLYVTRFEDVDDQEHSTPNYSFVKRVKGGVLARCADDATIYDGHIVASSDLEDEIPVIGRF